MIIGHLAPWGKPQMQATGFLAFWISQSRKGMGLTVWDISRLMEYLHILIRYDRVSGKMMKVA